MNRVGRLFGVESVTTTAVGRLVAVDAVAILVLVLIGEIRHGVDVVGNPIRVVETAAPFLLGWFLVAVLVGAYGDRAFDDRAVGIVVGVGAWLGGAGIGLTLRGTPYVAGNAPLSFALVMAGFGTLAIAIGRTIAIPRVQS
jgi:hypothetical protein